jgi:hypothetical protein
MKGSRGLHAIHQRPGHPAFDDLPWHVPIATWARYSDRFVDVERGAQSHAFAFVAYENSLYAVKAMSAADARREFEALETLESYRLPAVEPVAWARTLTDEGESGALITQFLDYSIPFSTLFRTSGLARYRERLLDAVAGLLARLHLSGIVWGDCSLANTLFRRDAGELQAFLVDAETMQANEAITDGQRRQDLMLMEQNVSGELQALSNEGPLPPGVGVRETGATIRERYERLWAEVAREDPIPPHQCFRLHERIRRLNELGFAVRDIALVPAINGRRPRIVPIVTDRDYNRHLLHSVAGVEAAEPQAALMLNEIREVQAILAARLGRRAPLAMAAYRWLEERYRPSVVRLSGVMQGGAGLPDLYCQVVEHRWYLSERAGQDVALDAAIDDYARRFQSV